MEDMEQAQVDMMLEKIERLVKVGWALAFLSFGMGVWATTLQNRVTNLELQFSDQKKDRDASMAEWRTWREMMTGKQASIDAKLDIVIAKQADRTKQ